MVHSGWMEKPSLWASPPSCRPRAEAAACSGLLQAPSLLSHFYQPGSRSRKPPCDNRQQPAGLALHCCSYNQRTPETVKGHQPVPSSRGGGEHPGGEGTLQSHCFIRQVFAEHLLWARHQGCPGEAMTNRSGPCLHSPSPPGDTHGNKVGTHNCLNQRMH